MNFPGASSLQYGNVLQKSLIVLLVLTAAVLCQRNGDVRLTGYGSNENGGLVEVYLSGSWSSVCGGETFTIPTASVVCRQLHKGPAVDVVYYPDLRYGISDHRPSIGNVVCTGSESHLLRCYYSTITECQPYHNVGVICSSPDLPYSGAVRILASSASDPKTLSVGLLQMYLGGEWGNVCYDQFTLDTAASACRQIGYTSVEKYTSTEIAASNQATAQTWHLDSVDCGPDSSCMSTCVNVTSTDSCDRGVTLYCLFDEDIVTSVAAGNRSTCTVSYPYVSDIRMTEQSVDNMQGVPEVYTGSHGWLKICIQDLSLSVADVVCKQLGFPIASLVHATHRYNRSNGVQFDCSGIESSTKQCQMSIVSQCDHFFNMRCLDSIPPYGSLRLFNGSGPAGSLHLFNGSFYQPLCDHQFGQNELKVACKQLGYETGIQVINNTLFGLSKFTTQPDNRIFKCSGDEDHILDCSVYDPDDSLCRNPYDAVSIQCGGSSDGHLRLSEGNGTSGVLQVEVGGVWGTACGLGFDHRDAHVACREMGFKTSNGFGMMQNINSIIMPILITSFQCSGFESDLLSCPHTVADNNTCQHEHDVYLYCSNEYPIEDGRVRLVDSSVENAGRVQISYHGLWKSFCGRLFTQSAADVLCRQIGYTNAEEYCTNACNGTGNETIFFGETACKGDETELIECETDIHNSELCSHKNDVWIRCSTNRLVTLTTSITTDPPTRPTSPSSSNIVPSVAGIEPKQHSLFPFDDIYLYVIMGGVVLVLVVAVVTSAIVCCICVCRKRRKRARSQPNTRQGQSSIGIDEPDMATSPRATNPNFLHASPLHSSDEFSMADLKVCPRKELEMAASSSFFNSPSRPDVPLELKGLNAAIRAGTISREQSGMFEEVDFGLELPPRYDDLEFDSSSNEYNNTPSQDSNSANRRGNNIERVVREKDQLMFTTIRIGEL